MSLSSSESTSARVILEPNARAFADAPSAVAPPAEIGLRGAIAAIAARRETSRALLMAADAAAVSFALGIGVQVVADAQLRPAALLAIPVAVVLARLFGLYERLGRGLERSTLTDLPRLLHMATLTALLASMLGRQLIFVTWEPATTLVFWLSLLLALPAGRAVARWIPAVLAPERCLVVGDLERAARVRRTILSLSAGRTHVVGWVSLDQISTASGRDALAAFVASERVDHLFVAPVVLDTAEVLDLVRSLVISTFK